MRVKTRSHSGVSSFVEECLSRIKDPQPGIALDIPCGYGRHTTLLASLGYQVIGADIDLRCVHATAASANAIPASVVRTVLLDANKPLPFAPRTVDVAVVVDYVNPILLAGLVDVLVPAGYLIFQTFGAHGQNWMALPKAGAVSSQLAAAFRPVVYREKAVGPRHASRVTVRCLLQKVADLLPDGRLAVAGIGCPLGWNAQLLKSGKVQQAQR